MNVDLPQGSAVNLILLIISMHVMTEPKREELTIMGYYYATAEDTILREETEE